MKPWPIKIVHLGLGRFHRAHQAVYYQQLFEKHGTQWGVAAFSMRSPNACNGLRAVGNRYPVIELAKEKTEVKWIDAISECYFAQEHFTKLNDLFCSAETEMVTLTITEKAYLLNSQGKLDVTLVKEDIANPGSPKSAIGMLFLGIKQRKTLLRKPLTVLSCDNLSENGSKLKNVLLDYAMCLGDLDTKNWIEQEISFPNSMVDRIVPSLTQDKINALQKEFNTANKELLITESFSQWVIEDDFKTQRPALQQVGVQFVSNVKPFEEAKLCLLNAAHSLIAYSGIAKLYTYVHEAIRDPIINAEVLGLFAEVLPLLKVPARFNLTNYTQLLLKRFDNPLLPHQLKQIAMDGSQKLTQRVLPSIQKARHQQLPHQYLDLVLYYWIQYLYQHTPDDPLRDKIQVLKKDCHDFESFQKKFWNEKLLQAR